MRFSTVIVTLLAATASVFATTLLRRQGYPSCTKTCFEIPHEGCVSTDVKCLCENKTFVASTTECFRKNCRDDDLKNALDLGDLNCRKVGVTLSASPPASTPSPSPSGAGSASSGAFKTSRDTILCLAAAALAAFCL